MHEETYFISEAVAETLSRAKGKGRLITAVGTTATRTLESAWQNGQVCPGRGKTQIFIYSPHTFQVIDQLLTNFYLPESTLMMISALAGRDLVLKAYNNAIKPLPFFQLPRLHVDPVNTSRIGKYNKSRGGGEPVDNLEKSIFKGIRFYPLFWCKPPRLKAEA